MLWFDEKSISRFSVGNIGNWKRWPSVWLFGNSAGSRPSSWPSSMSWSIPALVVSITVNYSFSLLLKTKSSTYQYEEERGKIKAVFVYIFLFTLFIWAIIANYLQQKEGVLVKLLLLFYKININIKMYILLCVVIEPPFR